ncbi:WXG100 family type VII secretion target [Micromonospora chokoriensis]
MPVDGTIKYNYEIIEDGIGQMQSVNKNIEALIESLARETGSALDAWTGPAAANYNELSQRIEGNFADLNTIVHNLATTLGLKASDMHEMDVRRGNRFQGA